MIPDKPGWYWLWNGAWERWTAVDVYMLDNGALVFGYADGILVNDLYYKWGGPCLGMPEVVSDVSPIVADRKD